MKLDFFVASSDEMVYDMRRSAIATGAAEPFVAGQTFDNTTRGVDAAVSIHSMVSDATGTLNFLRCLRASVGWKRLLLRALDPETRHRIDRTVYTVQIVVVVGANIVIVRASSAGGSSCAAIQQAVVGVEIRDVVRTSLDGSSGVGDKVVAYMGERALHGEGLG